MAVLADLYESAPMLPESSTPSNNPPSGSQKLYFKSDDELYGLNSGGTESQLSGGGSLPHDPGDDSGQVVLVDFTVTSSPAAGTEESVAVQIDGSDQFVVYAEADGSGGLQNQRTLVTSTEVFIGGQSEGDNTVEVRQPATRAVALGSNGPNTDADGVAIGPGANGGPSGVGIGRGVDAGQSGQQATGGVAIGRDTTINNNATSSIALGRNSTVESGNTDAIALAGATADASDQIAVKTGAAFDWPDDDGAVTLVDMGVTSTPAAGTEESFSIQVDANAIITAYAEADGGGGIQNQSARLPDGSASNPGMSFQGDLDTGVYRPAAGEIGFASGGAEVYTLTGSSETGDGMTADPETAQEDGFLQIDIGTTSYQVPIYAA